jgi:DNA-binding GntR family transcriptional regulator
MSAADPVTQDRVYRALKGDYLSGQYQAGARLELQSIADRLRSSKTPVREAIHRLVGENLFEADPSGGFRVCLLSPIALIQLYQWNAHLLMSMTHLLKASSLVELLDRVTLPEAIDGRTQIAARTARLFGAIAEETGNGEAIAAVSRLNERLLCVRLAEITDLDESIRELRVMMNSAVADVHKTIRRRLEAYHERRIRHQRAMIAASQSDP